MSNILSGFLRGAHDEDITSNVDNKAYTGVAVNSSNFIATKRGTLSKRAPFKLQRTLEQESYIIPYSYDDDEKYLIQFYKDENSDTKYKVLRYTEGKLIDSAFGGQEYVQPTFSSNTSDGHVISGINVYDRSTVYTAFNNGTISGPAIVMTITIEFPEPVLISTISYICGQTSSNLTSGSFRTTQLTAYDENGGTIPLGSISNPEMPVFWPVSGTQYLRQPETYINPDSIFIKKLQMHFKDYTWNQRQGNQGNAAAQVGQIRIKGQVLSQSTENAAPFTYEQAKEARTFNSFRKLYFVHKDFAPYELALTFTQPAYTGLDFTTSGNPTLVRVFQQRLVFAAFTNYPRRINLSKSAQYNIFTLPSSVPVATDPMEITIDEMKNPLTALFSGRQMLYAQSMDGLGTLNSGADDVPLTATILTARLRNETPLSRQIQPIRQDEIVYCVGSDEKTVYALDYDYQYARIPLAPLNEHCITYFDAGIKQMESMKGKLPYLVFLLNDGSLVFAIAYRSDTSFSFHCFPQKIADGQIQNIAVLKNTQTGFDTLFAVILHSNGRYTLESIESYSDFYTTQKGREFFKTHVLLDAETEINLEFATDFVFTYSGTQSSSGRCLFTFTPAPNSSQPELPDNQIKLLIDGQEIICRNVLFDEQGMWADVSEIPTENTASDGYLIPTKTFALPAYVGLNAIAFDGDDFIEKDTDSALNGTITFKKPMYQAVVGLRYTARSEFVNLSDAISAGFEKTIENIAACITYGTGLKIGTESALEKVGFTEYHYTEWQDRVLPDENLRNIPLADTPKKDKRIVVECDFPFPSNITFITYDIKITGVR